MYDISTRYEEDVKKQQICRDLVSFLLIILTAYTLVLFTCARTTISGSSMEPSIQAGDSVLINKMAYTVLAPKRYSVVAFYGPNGSSVYVKRIIGLPGETVQIVNGKVLINGTALSNDVVQTDIVTAGIASTPVTLADNEYFVLGDNRNNSEDSRFSSIGLIQRSEILGAVWMINAPASHVGLIH